MKTSYKHQGGWVASFLIVGILLTLAVLGGLYYVKTHQKELAGTQTATTPAATDSSTKKVTPDAATKEDKTKSGNSSQTTPQVAGTTNTNTAPTPKNTTDDSDETDDSNETGEEKADTNTATVTKPAATQPGTNAAKLPATGPEDGLFDAAILALLAFVVATYVRSRKAVTT